MCQFSHWGYCFAFAFLIELDLVDIYPSYDYYAAVAVVKHEFLSSISFSGSICAPCSLACLRGVAPHSKWSPIELVCWACQLNSRIQDPTRADILADELHLSLLLAWLVFLSSGRRNSTRTIYLSAARSLSSDRLSF